MSICTIRKRIISNTVWVFKQYIYGNKIQHQYQQNKEVYDKNTKQYHKLSKGKLILVNVDGNRPYTKGQILEKNIRPRSFKVQLEDRKILERNRSYIIRVPIESNANMLEGKELGINVEEENENSAKNNGNGNKEELEYTHMKEVDEEGKVESRTRVGRNVRIPKYLKDYIQ